MIISTTNAVDISTQFSNGSYESLADVPLEKGGDGKGFGPHELIEAALATCLTITVKLAARKYDIPLSGARCAVRLDRSVPGQVTLTYDLQLDGNLTDEQSAKLHDVASRCPVSKTMMGTVLVQPQSR